MEPKNSYLSAATFIVITMNFVLSLLLLCDIGVNGNDLAEIKDKMDFRPTFVPNILEMFEEEFD